MVSGASSCENMTTGRGVCRLTKTRCSSTSRVGESMSMTITSGFRSSIVFRSASGEDSVAVTSCPTRSSPSRSDSARSGDSSTMRTRMLGGRAGRILHRFGEQVVRLRPGFLPLGRVGFAEDVLKHPQERDRNGLVVPRLYSVGGMAPPELLHRVEDLFRPR